MSIDVGRLREVARGVYNWSGVDDMANSRLEPRQCLFGEREGGGCGVEGGWGDDASVLRLLRADGSSVVNGHE